MDGASAKNSLCFLLWPQETKAQFKRRAIVVSNSIDQLLKFDLSVTIESTFLLSSTVELSSTSSVVLHDSGATLIQTSR